MAMRVLALAVVALTLGGCMQETFQPASEASWNPRDRQLMSNLPYRQAAIPYTYRRHIVEYYRKEVPGSIVIDTDNKFLYYVLPKGKAIRYGVTVGEQGQAWTPTPGERQRLGTLPAFVAGGPHNPMGARGMYLFSGDKDTVPHPRH